MKILVVEDEKPIGSFIRKGLEERGFTVDLCNDGDEGYLRASSYPYDVVILDIMLPGRDGLSIVKGLRQNSNPVPVILLTARNGLSDRVEGLDLGADDYLTKPFFVDELVARVHALIRRATGDPIRFRQAGDLVLDLMTRQVRRGSRTIELTAREFNVLEYLMRLPGRVVTRTQLLEHIWGYHFDPSTNVVDVYIRRLRGKISAPGEEPLIETVRGVGYRLVAPGDTLAESTGPTPV